MCGVWGGWTVASSQPLRGAVFRFRAASEVDPFGRLHKADLGSYIVRARYGDCQSQHPAAWPHPDPIGRGLVPLLRVSRVVGESVSMLVCLCQVSSFCCSSMKDWAHSAHQSLSSLNRLSCSF